jgi:hypothetical protein
VSPTLQFEIFQILLASIIGGVWVGSTTFTAKRLGSGAGGLIGGLPAISAVSYLFIALNQSPENASKAAYAFPIGLTITFVYLLIYASLAHHGFKVAFTSAVTAWLLLAALDAILNLPTLIQPSILLIPVFLLAFYTLKIRLKLGNTPGVPIKPSRKDFLRRAILGGAVVGAAVTISQIGGPLLGGVAAAFPGIFSTTIYSTYEAEIDQTEGIRVSRALTKPLMMSAMIIAYPYSLIVSWAYASLGLVEGTTVAFAGGLFCAFLAYLLIGKRKI